MKNEKRGSARTLALVGLQAHVVRVSATAHKTAGTNSAWPRLRIEGMSEAAVREARIRVTAALRTVDVSVADYEIRVSGTAPAGAASAGFDLAIAVAILRSLGRMPAGDGVLLAELSLGGALRPVRGTLAALRSAKPDTAIVAEGAASAEAAMAPDVATFCAPSLAAVVAGDIERTSAVGRQWTQVSLADLGPHFAGALTELAAAAAKPRSHVLLIGEPGCGATMLARRAELLLPEMSAAERLDVACIQSAAGLLQGKAGRPFRAPHHTCSSAALLGGGQTPRPGEVTLAHHGVLFLDELPEFRRHCLESLGGAVRQGETTCRGATFPAAPWVIASARPCPCGYAGSTRRKCTCSAAAISRWRARLDSMAGLFDVRIDMPPPPAR